MGASSAINSLHILEQILKNITPFLFVFLNKFFSLRTIISYYSLYHRKACYTIKIHYFSEFKPVLFQFYLNQFKTSFDELWFRKQNFWDIPWVRVLKNTLKQFIFIRFTEKKLHYRHFSRILLQLKVYPFYECKI